MINTNAIFSRKENTFEPKDCVVEKVIRLSGTEYDRFTANMLSDQDFIKDNVDLMRQDSDGRSHCLLVVGEGRQDGILVDSSGSDYDRYAAFIPNVDGLLTVGQYPELAALNKKLTDISEHIAGQSQTGERTVVDLLDLETIFGIDLMTNCALRRVVLDMLNERPEISDWELDKNELILYCEAQPKLSAVDISDPTVTKTDMYAYGYSFEGMLPLGKDKALELFDKGHEVFLLYEDGTEGAVENRQEIEAFDGMFGTEDTSWEQQKEPMSIEVFIVNRERQAKGENVGEWLTLPADKDTLQGLFERIGIDRASEGAFNVSAVRVPYECLSDCVTKYDSIDELNMLASYMDGMADYERDKLQAILTSGLMGGANNLTEVINLLDADNFDAFNLISVDGFEELGGYYAEDKPRGISFEDYGRQIAEQEKGIFTEWGYIHARYGELLPEHTGVVPDEYKIVGTAFQSLRSKQTERTGDEKPSVVEKIRAARQVSHKPKGKDSTVSKKDKGGPEL